MDYENKWAQQFHIGALRNINTKMFSALGPDSGYDSIADFPIAAPLAKFLDRLARADKLTKTIIYNLNPADYEPIASIIGGFQDGSFPCKIQLGPLFRVILFNDEHHDMLEVARQIVKAISCTAEKAWEIMLAAHRQAAMRFYREGVEAC
jgi:glucuronate isomerase